MAYSDRPYYQDPPQQGGFGGRLAGASVVTWLLGINVIVFLLDSVLSSGMRTQNISPFAWGNFNVTQGIWGLQLWRVVTYQFLHGGLLHVAFNMLGLYFFGPMMEKWWGSRRFLAFYLLCGVSGALIAIPLSYIPALSFVTPTSQLIGASGSLFGILAACAALFPHQRVMLLFPPIPMSMRTMALLFIGLSFLGVLAGSPNTGGEAAHLAGALLGFLLAKNPSWLGWVDPLVDRAVPSPQAKAGRYETKLKQKREHEAKQQADVDRILDKVRAHGLQSLTAKEKKTLSQETERQNNEGNLR